MLFQLGQRLENFSPVDQKNPVPVERGRELECFLRLSTVKNLQRSPIVALGGLEVILCPVNPGQMAGILGHPRIKGPERTLPDIERFPVECVVRGYLMGSGWKDYQRTGKVCGHILPEGMLNGDKLPEPLFTPATKAELGDHDENISFKRAVEIVGKETAEELRSRSLEIFKEASDYAWDKGLVLVDTKFEFGRRKDGTIVLADEVLTPDSSRYWDLSDLKATSRGQTPPSFDKQVVRDYLEGLDWNKAPPPPDLPEEILIRTRGRYLDIVKRLTGEDLK